MSGRRVTPALVAAVRREVAAMDERCPGVKRSWRAELALSLAAASVDYGAPARDRVAAARGLGEVMAGLEGMAPAQQEADRLDELAAARERRKAATS